MISPLPALEDERLAELYSLNILDTPPEDDFTDIVELASYICRTPISHISLIERDRSWHKARIGLQDQETPRNISFCSHTICGSEPLIVHDASLDARFANNPYVLENPAIRFYAGFPLVTGNGHSVGTLCVVDTVPRALDAKQIKGLDILAKQVVVLLNERAKSQQLRQLTLLEQQRNKKLENLIDTQRRIMAILGHDTRGPLFYVNWMIRSMMNTGIQQSDLENNFQVIGNQLDSTLIMIEDLLEWSRVNILNATEEEHWFALKEMADNLFDSLKMPAANKMIRLQNDVPETLVGRKHERIIRFVLRNLLLNAIKFSRQGTIILSAIPGKDWLQFSITDAGIGMTADQVQEILNGGSRPTKGTAQEQGAGLGLLLIREFLQQVNGKLEIVSIQGKGTSVNVFIPA